MDDQEFVVFVSGRKDSGKDTLADLLVKEKGFVKFSFANYLKELVSEQYKIPLEYCHDQVKKESPLEQYPVNPQDESSKYLCGVLMVHFRDKEGKKPTEQELQLKAFDKFFWTPRALLILEGSTKRSVDPQYWVKKISDHVDQKRIVIPDWRYPNESIAVMTLKQFEKRKFVFVRVDSLKQDQQTQFDESETSLDQFSDFSLIVENSHDGIEKYHETIRENLYPLI